MFPFASLWKSHLAGACVNASVNMWNSPWHHSQKISIMQYSCTGHIVSHVLYHFKPVQISSVKQLLLLRKFSLCCMWLDVFQYSHFLNFPFRWECGTELWWRSDLALESSPTDRFGWGRSGSVCLYRPGTNDSATTKLFLAAVQSICVMVVTC